MRYRFYVVYEGERVERPTIFSSWGDVHPRVTGCYANYKGFNSSLPELREFLKARYEDGGWDEVIKPTGGENTEHLSGTGGFYAVAHGKSIGIFPCFCGKKGCKCQVDQVSGACHRRFKTKGQADAFIEDWKDSVAQIYYQAIRKALDDGKRPCNMKFDISGLLLVQAAKIEDKDGAKVEDTDGVSSQMEELTLG